MANITEEIWKDMLMDINGHISEDYVSFETAKLLKEKGFDTVVRHYYQKIDDDITYHIGDFRNWNAFDMWYSMPTLQMTMKWLREIHNIQIQIAPIMPNPKNWTFGIYKDFNLISSKLQCFDTYEQTVEETIKYCLKNLI